MAVTAAKPSRVADHRFYYAAGIAFLLVVFTGFARTYYLHRMFGEPSLPLLLHIHGAVMTLWYALYVVQVRLVATHRVALHRRLGVAGIFLAGLVAVMGTIVSIGLAKRRFLANPQSTGAAFLLGIQLLVLVVIFVVLVSAAVYFRRRTDYHKRLMTLAMLNELGPAITRLPFIDDHNVPVAIVLSISFLLTWIVVDTVRNRRLHPAFGWGGALSIGSTFVGAGLAQTSAWIHFARWWLA